MQQMQGNVGNLQIQKTLQFFISANDEGPTKIGILAINRTCCSNSTQKNFFSCSLDASLKKATIDG